MQQGMWHLGDEIHLKDLLLPKWCRIYHEKHLEVSFIPCRNEITKMMGYEPTNDTKYDTTSEECEMVIGPNPTIQCVKNHSSLSEEDNYREEVPLNNNMSNHY